MRWKLSSWTHKCDINCQETYIASIFNSYIQFIIRCCGLKTPLRAINGKLGVKKQIYGTCNQDSWISKLITSPWVQFCHETILHIFKYNFMRIIYMHPMIF